MHPLYRPIVLIIWLCAVSIGLNVLALWWLQEARIPATPVASSQADRTPIRLVEPPAERARYEPTVAGNEAPLAEREADIAQLQSEVDRLKSTKGDDGVAWRTKAEQLEQELTMLHKVAERVLEMDARHWQEGKLMLAHALVKEKTSSYGTP
jgi:multidrug resistance efflux pump